MLSAPTVGICKLPPLAKRHAENGSFFLAAGDGNGAAQAFHHLFGDGQTQAEAPGAVGAALIAAIEPVKYMHSTSPAAPLLPTPPPATALIPTVT